MTITKSELREMIRSVIKEELTERYKLTEARVVPEEKVLANHIGEDDAFIEACETGNAALVRAIIDNTMEELNMYTPGATKFRDTIFSLLGSGSQVEPIRRKYVATEILTYVFNCRLASVGLRSPDAKRYRW
jgi:hypothetical protein